MKRGKDAPSSIPKRSRVNNGLSLVPSHSDTIKIISDSNYVEYSDKEYVPSSTSASKDKANEDDATSVALMRTDNDSDRI
jgi:hypothetical protein